jgi:hypothetical protein
VFGGMADRSGFIGLRMNTPAIVNKRSGLVHRAAPEKIFSRAIKVRRIPSDESGVARQQAAGSLKESAGTNGGSPLNESPATWMSRKSKCPSRGDSRKE